MSADRGSLMSLKKRLPIASAPTITPELESRVLSVSTEREDVSSIVSVRQQHAVNTATAQQEVQIVSAGALLRAQPGKEKDLSIPKTYRLPSKLYEKLSTVAKYNNVTMTDIIVEALELHLPQFPQPPGDL